jgi:glycosyltransferase involved in cell wall biosynthesis
VIFINYALETFTPTQSGALATILWECCRVAAAEGESPYVVTRDSPVKTFDWPNTITVPYPRTDGSRIGSMLWRAERKFTGWRHLRHRAYAMRVVRAIRAAGLSRGPFVLVNDPEMTVYLRRQFPAAVIAHWFENQLDCREPFRSEYDKCASITFGVSDFTSRWVENYYHLERAHTLYNGVDAVQFAPSVHSTNNGPLPVINFVGRTGIEKGPDLLLKAALQLCDRTREFELQIVGSNHWDRLEMDDYQRELSGYVQELERQGIVVKRPGHIGRVQLPEALRRAQINVVPARWDEPFGMTTIEGMACGLATIASRTGGTPEVVGDAGILFERENVSALANSLYELVTQAGLRKDLSNLGRNRAEAFPWSRTWNSLKAQVRNSR